MRTLAILLALALSTSVFSNTTEEAASLYSRRGLDTQGLENAKASAEMYKTIIAESHDLSDVDKANLLVKQSEALYFVGLVLQRNDDEKGALKVFWEGYEVGLKAVNMLGDGPGDEPDSISPKVEGNEKVLALSMYWELVNILRWGKVYGVLQALSKWKKIGEPRIKDILKLDPLTMNYGVNRSAGKALLTLPGNGNILGKKAIDFLSEAYEGGINTVNGVTLSNNMATVTFYLEALRNEKKREQDFCAIYKPLETFMAHADDDTLNEMFPDLVPEAKFEYGDFMNEKDNTKFAQKHCR
jgi:hypothetical protein